MTDDRLICGLATVFGQPPEGPDRRPWDADAFRSFVQLGSPVPVKLDHAPVIQQGGMLQAVGRTLDHALVEQGTTPPGLLILAQLDGEIGDSLVGDIRRTLHPWAAASAPWGLSVRAAILEAEGSAAILEAWPAEVSLTRRPAFPDALVLAAGAEARSAWELLTGRVQRSRQW
jgi:hypothetical protein